MPEKNEHEYIVEYITLGNTVKVTAFDPVSLQEVSMIGAASVPKKQLARLAIRKLNYMIKKKKK